MTTSRYLACHHGSATVPHAEQVDTTGAIVRPDAPAHTCPEHLRRLGLAPVRRPAFLTRLDGVAIPTGRGADPPGTDLLTGGPPMCRARVLLPLTQLVVALRMAPVPEEIDETATCELTHRRGTHHSLVAEVDADHALWAAWEVNGSPYLQILPDCPSTSPDHMDGCSLYGRHKGPHTWQLRDPERATARSAVAAPLP
ncbi:hypothetical protein SAMN05216223_11450 [Actinacidiphila yanglinensis]|uniref:Uncharacterized protein n=1 Tax=Actinacidiphila yanglinensis TaxID=310779 RepID=A0A1H6DDN5_9ACTN|nr:hypothetical protein [Actinacidiphila yanglinensis]SEG83331.1 hypothetical protein SAMN05216223_11450 [Actinacidiphila yanglinensis]